MEDRILCVIFKNKIRLFKSLFDFINSIENTIMINSMDIIKLNVELQKTNKKIEIIVQKDEKIEKMYLQYINISSSENNFFDNDGMMVM